MRTQLRTQLRTLVRPFGRAEGNQGVRLDYYLTIEAAKQIAMMSGCDKGFEVRNYFLECERIAKRPPVAIDLNNREFLRSALLAYTENRPLTGLPGEKRNTT